MDNIDVPNTNKDVQYFPDDGGISKPPTTSQRRKKFRLRMIENLVVIFIGVIGYLLLPPNSFPEKAVLKVESGETLGMVVRKAKSLHIVKSSVILQSLTLLYGSDRDIKAGDYYFNHSVMVTKVAQMLASGDFNMIPVKVTFPEGLTRSEMVIIAEKLLIGFDGSVFMKLTEEKEGYLFPDTYLVSPKITANEFIDQISQNYDSKISSFHDVIKNSNRSEIEIIIMASIIEREANGDDDRALISGILWKRFDNGMRLQVDAPFIYMTGKEAKDITSEDRKINSPYNTYLHEGLTPTPIGNPGLASINASIYPKESPYLFYLHDNKGEVHYAKTFEEHKQNIKQYLR